MSYTSCRANSLFLTLFILFGIMSQGFTQNQAKIDSLRQILSKEKKDTSKINLHLKIAGEYYSNSSKKTRLHLTKAKKILEGKNLNYPKGSIDIKIFEVKVLRYKTKFKEAEKLAKKAEKLAVKKSYFLGQAKIAILLGIVYDDLGKYNKAISYYKKALKIAEKIKHKDLIQTSYNDLGVTYENLGNYPLSMSYYQKSLKIAKEIKDLLSVARAYNNIGIIYNLQEDTVKAIKYYKKAEKINSQLSNKSALAINYANIGHVYRKTKSYKKALGYYRRALKIGLDTQDNIEIAADYSDMGAVYNLMKAYDKALYYQKKSLQMRKKSGEFNDLSVNYYEIGLAYFNKKELNQAEEFAQKAYKLAKKIGHLEYKKKASELLSKVYEKLNSYKKAYKYLKIFKQITDTLLNKENTKKITLLEAEYKFDAERQILKNDRDQLQFQMLVAIIGSIIFLILALIILRLYLFKKRSNKKLIELNQAIKSQNEEIKQQSEEILQQSEQILEKSKLVEIQKIKLEYKNKNLEELNDEKNLLIGVVAHDLKSPLNQITGLIELFNYSPEKISEEHQQYIKMIGESSARLKNMITKILDISAIDSKQLNLDIEPIDVINLLNATGNNFEVQAQNKNIKIHYPSDKENSFFINADKDYLKQVIENLLSNAIKFSEKHKSIFLEIEETPYSYKIKVKDEGPGIDKSEQKKLFLKYHQLSAQPTDNEDSSGLGLAIVKKFVEAMNARIYVDSELGKGSAFMIEFEKI